MLKRRFVGESLVRTVEDSGIPQLIRVPSNGERFQKVGERKWFDAIEDYPPRTPLATCCDDKDHVGLSRERLRRLPLKAGTVSI